MTKNELLDLLAKTGGVTRAEALRQFTAIRDRLKFELEHRGEAKFPFVCHFYRKDGLPRESHNPKTLEKVGMRVPLPTVRARAMPDMRRSVGWKPWSERERGEA